LRSNPQAPGGGEVGGRQNGVLERAQMHEGFDRLDGVVADLTDLDESVADVVALFGLNTGLHELIQLHFNVVFPASFLRARFRAEPEKQ
jgi:hypothetical protein